MQRTARIRGGRRVWEGVAGGQGGERGCEEGREREDPSPRGVRLGAGCCRLQRWVPGAGRWQEVPPPPPRTLPAAWPPQGSSPAAPLLCPASSPTALGQPLHPHGEAGPQSEGLRSQTAKDQANTSLSTGVQKSPPKTRKELWVTCSFIQQSSPRCSGPGPALGPLREQSLAPTDRGHNPGAPSREGTRPTAGFPPWEPGPWHPKGSVRSFQK